jgi:hypothetical protein
MNDKTNEYRADIASEWRNVLKTPANLHLLSTQLSVLCAMAEADAIAERAHYGDMMSAKLGQCENERDALRDALQSLVDGKSEFDIEYDTGMDTTEARRIMDLAYNRK